MNRIRAFLFLARCLASEENPNCRPTSLEREMAAGRVSWERLVEVASEYWMTVALYQALREKHLLSSLPGELVYYFETVHELNSARNLALVQHAGELAGVLNRIGVEPLLLKGCCHLVSGLYTDPAVRVMDDIDILVPADRALECWRILISCGYRTASECRHLDVESMPFQEWPYLLCPRHTGAVEMHRVTEWPHMMGAIDWYRDSEHRGLPGGRVQIPSPTNRMILSLAHSHVHHRYLQAGVLLRDLYDAMLLSNKAGDEIAWPGVIDVFDRADETDALRTACWMRRRLLGQNLPGGLEAPPRAGIYWQRCMLNVANPELIPLQELVVRNLGLLGAAIRLSPEGRRARREVASPSVVIRKFRTALRISRQALKRRDRNGS